MSDLNRRAFFGAIAAIPAAVPSVEADDRQEAYPLAVNPEQKWTLLADPHRWIASLTT